MVVMVVVVVVVVHPTGVMSLCIGTLE